MIKIEELKIGDRVRKIAWDMDIHIEIVEIHHCQESLTIKWCEANAQLSKLTDTMFFDSIKENPDYWEYHSYASVHIVEDITDFKWVGKTLWKEGLNSYQKLIYVSKEEFVTENSSGSLLVWDLKRRGKDWYYLDKDAESLGSPVL